MVKLTDVDICSTVKVEGLLSEGYLRERMLALGLTGPKDNLTVYNIRGAMIALRKEEGQKILVSYI